MGNYRFRLTSMIPNSWFYKFNDSSTSNKVKRKTSVKQLNKPQTDEVDQRKSYYFTRNVAIPDTTIPDPPRKSSKQKKTSNPKSLNNRGECVWTKSNSSDTEVESPKLSHTCSYKTNSSYEDVYAKVDLKPIITKPVKQVEYQSDKRAVRKVKGNSYSPRIGNRVRVQRLNGRRRGNGNRQRLSDSMVVVKTSVDPGKDFKESMVEMIMENGIKTSKDLEDLLACYLSLNSEEYHDLIIEVFKQIWFESTHIIL